MNNVIQNCINKSFDNISYNLADYTDVITKSNFEHFILKVFLLLITLSMSAGLSYYALNKKHTKNRKSKPMILKIKKKKFYYIPNANLTKGEKLLNSTYLFVYAAIYIVAGYLLIVGVM